MKLKTIGYRKSSRGTIVKTFSLNNLMLYRKIDNQWQGMYSYGWRNVSRHLIKIALGARNV
jgi:hypothetical protein